MTTLYHNPKCSKSRQTLALLQEQNIEPTIIEYLKTPPSVEELTHILALLKLSPRDLMRQKESLYQDLGLDNPTLTDGELIQTMVDHPGLIERPIVVHNNQAVIGRPPNNVLTIISH